jgi:hypothetical protein
MTETPYADGTLIDNADAVKEEAIQAVNDILPALVEVRKSDKTTPEVLTDIADIVSAHHTSYLEEVSNMQVLAAAGAETALSDDSGALNAKEQIKALATSVLSKIKMTVRNQEEESRRLTDELPKIELERRNAAITLFGTPDPVITENVTRDQKAKELGPTVATIIAMGIVDFLFGIAVFEFISSTQAAIAIIAVWIGLVNFAILRWVNLDKLAIALKETRRQFQKSFPDGGDPVTKKKAVSVFELPIDWSTQRKQMIFLFFGCLISLGVMRVYAYSVGKHDPKAIFGTVVLILLALGSLVVKRALTKSKYPEDLLSKYFALCRAQRNMKARQGQLAKAQTNPEIIALHKEYLKEIEPLIKTVETESKQLKDAKAEIIRVASANSENVIDWPTLYVDSAHKFADQMTEAGLDATLPTDGELRVIYDSVAPSALPTVEPAIIQKLETAIEKLSLPESGDVYGLIKDIRVDVLNDLNKESEAARTAKLFEKINSSKLKPGSPRLTAARV